MLCALDTQHETLLCPYDKAHVVERVRFQVHLSRCRQNVKNNPLQHCPFNAIHMVYAPEMQWHLQECENRVEYEQFIHTVEISDKCLPTPVSEVPEVPTTENWDAEPPVETYNAQLYAENAPVLRNCQNAPPLVRKNFRYQEHKRLSGMDNM